MGKSVLIWLLAIGLLGVLLVAESSFATDVSEVNERDYDLYDSSQGDSVELRAPPLNDIFPSFNYTFEY